MYIKDFDKWNKTKKSLQSVKRNCLFRERDMWWCSVGINIGGEEDGKNILFERPVLVVKKFNNDLAWVLPMTTKIKDGPYYFHFEKECVLLSQLRLVSVRRFNRYIRRLTTYEFSLIIWRLIDLLRYP